MKKKGLFFGVCAVDVLALAGCIYLYVNQDRTAPEISFAGTEITYTDGTEMEALLEGVSAYDERDGDVSDSLLIEKISRTADGQAVVTYAARDASNNVAKSSRILPAEWSSPETTSLTGMETDTEQAIIPEAESETETETEEDETETASSEEAQEDEVSAGEAAQESGRAAESSAEQEAEVRQEEAEVRQNAAPVLTLSSSSISVAAGSATVDWNSCIQQLSDDTDSRDQLFANLVMEGHVDLNTPGSYPVVLYTRDSEGALSERRSVIVVVS